MLWQVGNVDAAVRKTYVAATAAGLGVPEASIEIGGVRAGSTVVSTVVGVKDTVAARSVIAKARSRDGLAGAIEEAGLGDCSISPPVLATRVPASSSPAAQGAAAAPGRRTSSMAASRTKLTAREVSLLEAAEVFAKRQSKQRKGSVVITLPAPFELSGQVGTRTVAPVKPQPRRQLARYEGSVGGDESDDSDDGAAYRESGVGMSSERQQRFKVNARQRLSRLAAKARREFEARQAEGAMETRPEAFCFATDGRGFDGRRVTDDGVLAERGVSSRELSAFQGPGMRGRMAASASEARQTYEERRAAALASGQSDLGTVTKPFQFQATHGAAKRAARRLELQKAAARRDEGRDEDDEEGDPSDFEDRLDVDEDEVDENGLRVYVKAAEFGGMGRALGGAKMRLDASEALAEAREVYESRARDAETGALASTVAVSPQFTVTAGQRRRAEQRRELARRAARRSEGRDEDDEEGDPPDFEEALPGDAELALAFAAGGVEAGLSRHGVGGSSSGATAKEEIAQFHGARMRADMAGALADAKQAYEERAGSEGLATVAVAPNLTATVQRASNPDYQDEAWLERHRTEVVSRGVSAVQMNAFATGLREKTSSALSDARALFESRMKKAGGSVNGMGTVSRAPSFTGRMRPPNALSTAEALEEVKRRSHASQAEVRAFHGPRGRAATAELLAKEKADYAARRRRQAELGQAGTVPDTLGHYAKATKNSSNTGAPGRPGGGFDDAGFSGGGCQAEAEARYRLNMRGSSSLHLAQAKVDYDRRREGGFASTKATAPRCGGDNITSVWRTRGVVSGSAGTGALASNENRAARNINARKLMGAENARSAETWAARRKETGGRTEPKDMGRLAKLTASQVATLLEKREAERDRERERERNSGRAPPSRSRPPSFSKPAASTALAAAPPSSTEEDLDGMHAIDEGSDLED